MLKRLKEWVKTAFGIATVSCISILITYEVIRGDGIFILMFLVCLGVVTGISYLFYAGDK